MPFALYLELDDPARAAFDRVVDEIEASGKAITTPRRAGQQHHLTLAVYKDLDTDLAVPLLTRFARETQAQSISLPVIGCFQGKKNVLFVAPDITEELLALHRRYHELTEPLGHGEALYHVGAWLPHLTLATDVSVDQVDAIRGVITDMWTPITAVLTRLRLIRFSPVETIWASDLAVDDG